MKNRYKILLTLASFVLAIPLITLTSEKKVDKVEGYNASSLPTTIDLNDNTESEIRSYYSSLSSLDTSERQGTNLLKNLKTILKKDQKYYSYDSGDTIWRMYEITDRDWDKSPASDISGYNSKTNTITGYTYKNTSVLDPYIRAYYVNRDVENQTRAWADHGQDEWGINREHMWAKAEGFETSGAGGARGDPMHLVAANGYANNIHSNYFFGYVKTSSEDCGEKYANLSGNLRGTSLTLNTSQNVFEPQDCDKGDIARMIFYMVARYNYLSGSDSDGINSNNPNLTLVQNTSSWEGTGYTSTTTNPGKMGILSDLLAWHKADPVDGYEIHRNNLLYKNFTNNRNPFIDFPEWADYIWGTVEYNGKNYQSFSTTPTGYAVPSSDIVNGYKTGETVSVTGVSLSKSSLDLKVDDTETLVATISPSNATNKSVTWTSSNTDVATVSNNGLVTAISNGNATITVTTSDGSFTDTCLVSVTKNLEIAASITIGDYASDNSWSNNTKHTSLTMDDKISISVSDSTYTGKYYTADNTWRLYQSENGTLTINLGDSGYHLINATITFTTTSNGTLIDSSEEAISSGSTIKLSGTSAIFTASGTSTGGVVRISSITVVYAPNLTSITLDTSNVQTSFTVGDTFTYSGLVVTAHYTGNVSQTVNPTSVSSPDMSTSGNKTITVIYETVSATYSITVDEGSAPDPIEVDATYYKFVEVTNVSDLKDGDIIVIANSEKSHIISTTQNDNNRSAFSVSNFTNITSSSAERIELVKSGNYWNFKVANGFLYAPGDGSKKNLLRTEEGIDNNNYAKWSISISNNVTSIIAQGTNSNKYMRYNPNNGNPIFSCYASGSSISSTPVIYKSYESEADRLWADPFLNQNTSGCKSSGIGSTIDWSTSKTNYNSLTREAKTVLLDGTASQLSTAYLYQQALARYEFIVLKYGSNTYENYISRNIASSGRINLPLLSENNSNFVIIGVAVISILSVAAFFLISKRKED